MQQLFPAEGEREPKLRFKAFSGEWVEKKLGDVAIKKSSNILANTLVNNKGKYSIYGASGYLQNIDFYNEDDPYIAIIKDGSGVGRSFLCVEKSSVIGTLQVIKPLNKDNLAFLYLLINKIDFGKYISGGAIPHIYFKDYSKEIIKIPSPPEQQKIANTLSTLDNLIEAQNQQINHLKQHKKGLMQQLFVSDEEK
jgi:type I restriction enzyme S subunit